MAKLDLVDVGVNRAAAGSLALQLICRLFQTVDNRRQNTHRVFQRSLKVVGGHLVRFQGADGVFGRRAALRFQHQPVVLDLYVFSDFSHQRALVLRLESKQRSIYVHAERGHILPNPLFDQVTQAAHIRMVGADPNLFPSGAAFQGKLDLRRAWRFLNNRFPFRPSLRHLWAAHAVIKARLELVQKLGERGDGQVFAHEGQELLFRHFFHAGQQAAQRRCVLAVTLQGFRVKILIQIDFGEQNGTVGFAQHAAVRFQNRFIGDWHRLVSLQKLQQN